MNEDVVSVEKFNSFLAIDKMFKQNYLFFKINKEIIHNLHLFIFALFWISKKGVKFFIFSCCMLQFIGTKNEREE